jgi:hypothetical protein
MKTLAALVAAAGVLYAAPALADDKPFAIGAKPAWYLLGGATAGGTLVAQGSGYVGGELSVARLQSGRYFGLYGDGYYDFGIKRTYTTLGPEIGWKFIGIDGGGAARWGGKHAELGPTGRVFLSVGILAVYARYTYFPDSISDKSDHVFQIGGLLKMPFASWGL